MTIDKFDKDFMLLQNAISEFIMNPINFQGVKSSTRKILCSILQENPVILKYLSSLFEGKTKKDILDVLSMKKNNIRENSILGDLDIQIKEKNQELERLNLLMDQSKKYLDCLKNVSNDLSKLLSFQNFSDDKLLSDEDLPVDEKLEQTDDCNLSDNMKVFYNLLEKLSDNPVSIQNAILKIWGKMQFYGYKDKSELIEKIIVTLNKYLEPIDPNKNPDYSGIKNFLLDDKKCELFYNELSSSIEKSLSVLKGGDIDIFKLRFFDKKSFKDIADEKSVVLTNVTMNINRSFGKIREFIFEGKIFEGNTNTKNRGRNHIDKKKGGEIVGMPSAVSDLYRFLFEYLKVRIGDDESVNNIAQDSILRVRKYMNSNHLGSGDISEKIIQDSINRNWSYIHLGKGSFGLSNLLENIFLIVDKRGKKLYKSGFDQKYFSEKFKIKTEQNFNNLFCELSEWIEKSFVVLTDKQRNVVDLAVIQHKSYEEITKIIGGSSSLPGVTLDYSFDQMKQFLFYGYVPNKKNKKDAKQQGIETVQEELKEETLEERIKEELIEEEVVEETVEETVEKVEEIVEETVEEKIEETGKITINAIEYQAEESPSIYVDCPGHACDVENLITGTGHTDGAFLVVAMPKVEEHALFDGKYNVPKLDVVEKETIIKRPDLDEKLKDITLTSDNIDRILSGYVSDYISFYIKDRDISIGLVQYSMKKILGGLKMGKYKGEGSFSSWIFDVLDDNIRQLQLAVNSLSDEEKEVIEPRIQEGLSTKELVKKTGLASGTIKNIINLASQKLLKSLGKTVEEKKSVSPDLIKTNSNNNKPTEKKTETKEFIDPNMDERIIEDFKKFNLILSFVSIQLPLVDKVQGRKNSEWILDKYKTILDNEKLDKDILSQLKSRINARYTVYSAVRTEEWYFEFLNSMMAIVDHIMTRK